MKRNPSRILGLATVLFALFALLIAQFYHIQIVEGDKWSRIAQKQHFFYVQEPFLRGTFLSNTTLKKKHPDKIQSFVVDVQKYHLHVDSLAIPAPHKKAIAAFLLATLDLSLAEQGNLPKQLLKKSRSRRLATWLDQETHDRITEWWVAYAKQAKLPKNALFFVSDYQRSYPFGKLLGQILHTIQSNKNENTGQAIPTGGLELYFNGVLEGKRGKRRLMRSPRNAFETGEVISTPRNGANIYLTINHCLQAIAEEELARGVKYCKAKGGWAVLMEPHTGEIWALAQYPFFYPSDYQTYFNNPELLDHTRVKAITDANEPGSVMKPCVAAIALEANDSLSRKGEPPIFSPQDKVNTSKGIFKGRPKPLKDTRLHHYLNMEMAIWKSSNIYIARLVEGMVTRLGKEWFRNQLKERFGYGEKTGIELPGESGGVLPMPGKKHPNGKEEWSAGTPYTIGMGHNIQASGLQLARAYAVFANGGYLVKPTLVRKIVQEDHTGTVEILLDNTKKTRTLSFPRVFSEKTVAQVIRALKFATKTGGAGTRANIWGYTEAGKSGTANKVVKGGYSETQYCSSFVGFAPVTSPVFVLLVTMDEPEYGYVPGIGKRHHGGGCAAPVFRAIATRVLDYLGIPPDDPYGYPPGDPRYDATKADWVMETRRLQEIYETWNNI